MDYPAFSFQEELMLQQQQQQQGELLCWAFSPDLDDLIIPSGVLLDPSPPPVAPISAFVRYARNHDGRLLSSESKTSSQNIHRRVVEFLRRIPTTTTRLENNEGDMSSRGFRHMMRERQRREKLSQSYADLHSMLSSRSKADKNSIVQSASVYVRELKGVKEELQRRNQELIKLRIARRNEEEEKTTGGGAKIRLRVANPSSAIDSMVGALRCLKGMDVKARTIRSNLSTQEFTATMDIQTQVATAEVEKAVETMLMEVEKKLLHTPFPRKSGWSHPCHVENTF